MPARLGLSSADFTTRHDQCMNGAHAGAPTRAAPTNRAHAHTPADEGARARDPIHRENFVDAPLAFERATGRKARRSRALGEDSRRRERSRTRRSRNRAVPRPRGRRGITCVAASRTRRRFDRSEVSDVSGSPARDGGGDEGGREVSRADKTYRRRTWWFSSSSTSRGPTVTATWAGATCHGDASAARFSLSLA